MKLSLDSVTGLTHTRDMTSTQFLASHTSNQAAAIRRAAAIITAAPNQANELARMATRWPALAIATALYLGMAK